MKVIEGGIRTLTEDWPGRVGYRNKGIPPSGPVDHFAHRAANLIVGNAVGEVGLEIIAGMFEAEFTEDTVISITGADAKATVNSQSVPMWESIRVSKGDVICFGYIQDLGLVSYLGIAGGINVPTFLGSKSTCTNGSFGGFKGRELQEGDELELGKPKNRLSDLENRRFRKDLIPQYSRVWEVRAVPGPQSAPDYFTEEGMDMWFSQPFQVDHRATRSGYRLLNPKPIFSRKAGSQGAHPSNLFLQPYSPGTLNVCGDFGVILFVDGVSEGGFVCPLTIIHADLWKIGQTVPFDDAIKFIPCSVEEARNARFEQDRIFSEPGIVIQKGE